MTNTQAPNKWCTHGKHYCPITEFTQTDSWCRDCRRLYGTEYMRQYRRSHKATIHASAQCRYQQKSGAIRAQHGEYYAANREAVLERNRQYRRRHRISVNAVKAVYQKQWAKTPQGHAKTIRDAAMRRARLAQAEGSFTVQEWLTLKEYHRNRCVHCGADESRQRLTVDHVIPLSLGGANYITNIQPLCGPCNGSKGIKTVDYRGK